MTPAQVNLVQTSFAKVAPIAETAAGLFYTRLFEIAPEVRPLFKGSTIEQGRKLMAALSMIVKGLSNPATVLPEVRLLAVRHVNYGVKPDHYVLVGEALIWTLEKGLGDEFTPETREAWVTAYTTLSSVMIEEAYGNVRV
jgi:hemoglobin-like flavoprotein